MKNRAKCKLCLSIIESFHATDYVVCKCGEIVVDGGDALRCAANNWENFLRVDDEGNEIVVKIEDFSKYDLADKHSYSTDTPSSHDETNKFTDIKSKSKTSKKELLDMLRGMIKSIDNLPEHAKTNPINHYDYESLLVLLLALFSDD